MPLKSGKLTTKEAIFVGHMAATGDATYSAKMAGYRHEVELGIQKANNPALAEITRKAQAVRVSSQLLPLAVDGLQEILTGKTLAGDPYPVTVRDRRGAIDTVLKYSLGGKDDGEAKDPSEMTPAEIQARIDSLRRAQSDKAKLVIEGDAAPAAKGVFD